MEDKREGVHRSASCHGWRSMQFPSLRPRFLLFLRCPRSAQLFFTHSRLSFGSPTTGESRTMPANPTRLTSLLLLLFSILAF